MCLFGKQAYDSGLEPGLFLDSSKLKEFADDNLKFDDNERKLSKQVENTVGKGEIACYDNFSFYHSVFKRLVSQGRQKVSLCGNGIIEAVYIIC